MMSEYMPGPWSLWHNEKGAFIVTVNTPEGTTICSRNSIERHAAESIANAHLIAAAPDMFELLKLAIGDSEYVLSNWFWDEVREIIAKVDSRT